MSRKPCRDIACLWFNQEELLALTVALDTVLMVARDGLSVENESLLRDLRQQVRGHL